jgi:ATP-binding protein involved in chromosome partitioning
MGSLIPEAEALEFESTAQGGSHTWRATREFALLGEILGSVEWGALDLLMFDLPPGADRTVQYADFLEARTSFLLVTIPSEVSRGVVARSVAALSKRPNHLLGYVENMSGYYCRECNAIKPLFDSGREASSRRLPQRAHSPGLHDPRSVRASEPSDLDIPCLGTIPFDPELARHCDQGIPLESLPETLVGQALAHVAQQLLDSLESTTPASAHASPDLRPDKEPRR